MHRPTPGQAWHHLWRRALLPAVLLLAGVTGLGLLVTGPLAGLLAGEDRVNEAFVDLRTPALDTLTYWWSFLGSTEVIIGGCVVVIGVLWWRTGRWWWAALPGVAVAVQAAVFMLSALLVGRERPDVEKLDPAPPTSSFPSGHTGAAVAFWWSLALLAREIRTTWLRWTAIVVCAAVPPLVGVARIYRGMHHPSDVVVGGLNGVVCVLLAYAYLRPLLAVERGVQDEVAAGQVRA